MLSIGVLERGVILVGTLICGDNKNGSHVTCEIAVLEKKSNVNDFSKYWDISHKGAKKGIFNQPGIPNGKNS